MTPETILAKLAELGDTPDAIAESLRARGIKGDKRSATSCPLANYLRECGAEYPVVFDWAWVTQDDGEQGVEVPAHAYQFARSFDADAYPFLESAPVSE